ncbi:MAG: class I SAM-dependent methyltransferase [Myxococcaceae bacterium]|nr:class I SAM-dependent methyltransferase [Myxococcaceae bacterium]MBH2005818.1 class I SAM-dependent methyltransferase [Myxococcaceae bacterium]
MENLWEELSSQNIHLSLRQKEQLRIHRDLLQKWGDVHNLTALKDPALILKNHYKDCLLGLHALPMGFLEPSSEVFYDLGSGAGFPGLVAAVLWPARAIVLVESSQKKSSFLHLAAFEMGLTQVQVLSKRVENLRGIQRALSRAAFSPENFKILKHAFGPEAKLALFTSCAFEPESLGKVKMSLEQICKYTLEPNNERQLAVGVSRGTSR